jgi:hypothetical protein
VKTSNLQNYPPGENYTCVNPGSGVGGIYCYGLKFKPKIFGESLAEEQVQPHL